MKTDLESKIYQQGEVYLFTEYDEILRDKTLRMTRLSHSERSEESQNIKYIQTPTTSYKLDLDFVFEKSWELGIKSILIEAGGHLNGEALKYADKIYHFIAPKITGDNSSRSCFDYRKISDINDCENFEFKSVEKFGKDILLIYSKISR